MAKTSATRQNGGANLGFEATLWAATDKLRGHMDAAEYRHVVLGLIFLKYISDAFEFARTIFTKMKANDEESRTLDALLPKLLSGAVRVSAVTEALAG